MPVTWSEGSMTWVQICVLGISGEIQSRRGMCGGVLCALWKLLGRWIFPSHYLLPLSFSLTWTSRTLAECCVNKHRPLPAIMSTWTGNSSYSDLSVNSWLTWVPFFCSDFLKTSLKCIKKEKRPSENIYCIDKLDILNIIKSQITKVLNRSLRSFFYIPVFLHETYAEILKSVVSWVIYFWNRAWLFSSGKDKHWGKKDRGYYFQQRPFSFPISMWVC